MTSLYVELGTIIFKINGRTWNIIILAKDAEVYMPFSLMNSPSIFLFLMIEISQHTCISLFWWFLMTFFYRCNLEYKETSQASFVDFAFSDSVIAYEAQIVVENWCQTRICPDTLQTRVRYVIWHILIFHFSFFIYFGYVFCFWYVKVKGTLLFFIIICFFGL